jgi:hypothetical protein
MKINARVGESRMRKPIAERLWARTDKTNGCWLWRGCVMDCGYGQIGEGGQFGRVRLAHRVAWELAHGPIPDGLMVLHRCDVRRCVNPAHLFLGTAADNSKDMVIKGRSFVGERQPNARLTDAAVQEMRALHATGMATFTELARRFGVSRRTATDAIRGVAWRHLCIVDDDRRSKMTVRS